MRRKEREVKETETIQQMLGEFKGGRLGEKNSVGLGVFVRGGGE